jgi:2,3-diphosphopglycerate-independent phosphoglycerate mutase
MAIDVPSFEELHGLKALLIAPTPIIAGIGKTVGLSLLKAPGATGTLDTDMLSKAKTAMDALFTNDFDMAVIHIKCADDCGHDGDAEGKIDVFQRVDDMVKWILNYPAIESGDHIIAVTGDHSTPINVSDHTSEPVPFVVSLTKSALKGHPTLFDEVSCSRGVLGRFSGSSIMPILKNLRTNYQIVKQ